MSFGLKSFGQVSDVKLPKPAGFPVIPSVTPTGVPSKVGNNRGLSIQEANLRRIQQDIRNQERRQTAISNRSLYSDLPSTISYTLPDRSSLKGTEFFREALHMINEMLEGKTKLDLKKAVFIVENAYYGNRMDYKQFNKAIQDAAYICRLKMREYGSEDDLVKNLTIFNYISDTTRVKLPGTEKILTRFPMKYDFNDYQGKEQWSNMFVSKLMGTHSGQCHSMPLYFQILSQELGSESYITHSPNHSFIRFKSKKGNWYNAELTCGAIVSDASIMECGYVKAEALKSGIYMDTLSMHETVACCINDLASGYIRKYGYDSFSKKCVDAVRKYYPNQLHAIMGEANWQTVTTTYIARQKGRPPVEIFKRDTLAKKSLDRMHELYSILNNLGYEDMPKKHYDNWLNGLKKAKTKPENQKSFIHQITK